MASATRVFARKRPRCWPEMLESTTSEPSGRHGRGGSRLRLQSASGHRGSRSPERVERSWEGSGLRGQNRSCPGLFERFGSRTFYVQSGMPTQEDLTEIERAGRRCAICRSGRRWRQLQVARSEGEMPVVMCAACRARYGTAPPLSATQEAAAAPVVAPEVVAPKQRGTPSEDRLRKALRQLPRKPNSVAQVAKAAGLNHDKTLKRLRALQAAGEVQQVGKRWSIQPPSTDVEAAFDRLQARTSNLRIIRDREPVG